MDQPWYAFRPDERGLLVDRPNRFVVRVDLGGRLVEAHCPNPGRMTELLFPGTPVVLERAAGDRKLAYTLAAVERPGPPVVVPVASSRSNAAVQALVLPRQFPGTAVVPEYTVGGSRFDFLVEWNGVRHLVEVKACSEVEFGTALFPDAPSDRARRHLEHLAEASDRGYVPHVVLAVVHGRPRYWAPNVHTDPGFARTLARLAPRLNLHAVVFETQADGATRVVDPGLPVVLPDPGPDAGHLIRVAPGPDRWSVTVEWYPSGLEKAVRGAPARSSFALRGTEDRREELRQALGPAERPDDPRLDRGFVAAVLERRHAGIRG